MNRFFIDDTADENRFVITGDNYKHIKNVLRIQVGESIEICNFGACYVCVIESIDASKIVAKIEEKYENTNELNCKINLFQGLPKKDKMELVITKCIELGVNEIYPTMMERTIVKYDNKKVKNKMTRWSKIALSASMQSKRNKVVQVNEPKKLKDFEDVLKSADLTLVLYENDNDFGSFKTFLSTIQNYGTINVIVGPEGGISDDEIEYLLSIGAKTVSLGRRILRTETAGMAFLSCASVFLEE